MYQKILVPIDGSETSQRGLLEAINLAKALGAQLFLLHVVNELVLYDTYTMGGYTGDIIEILRTVGRQLVDEAELVVRKHDLEPETILLECVGGSTSKLILEQAHKFSAELIVMGTHGRRGLRRVAMGSDAESVVRDASIPVLLVHGPSVVTPTR